MTRPRVSLGLPVFNGERFLREALDSILAQTFLDFELIISDNASTDGTEEICRTYAANDGRIRYNRNETNLGAAKNFNRTFELSCGEYFKWTAADDTLETECLARCVDVLDKDPQVVLAYPMATFVYESEQVPRASKLSRHRPDLTSPFARDRMRQMFFPVSPDMYVHGAIFGLLRSAALRDTPLIRNCLASDVCLLVDLGLRGKLVEIPERLLRIRVHRDSYTYKLRLAKRVTGKEGEREVRWFDPSKKTGITLPTWRLFWEHLLSTARCKETLVDKLGITVLLFRAANWQRKALGNELRLAITETLEPTPFGLVARPVAFGVEKIFTGIMILVEGVFQVFRWFSKLGPRSQT
jgi:glycosyltransferase involved in cell wall biosynthesis